MIRVLQVLRNYGYTCYLANHNFAKLTSALNYYKMPVYAYGADLRDKNNLKAHSWIIDGYSNTDRYVTYSLHTLNPREYPDFEYITPDNCEDDTYYVQPGLTHFHMNWGARGKYDGWYMDNNIATGEYNFSSSRSEIYFK